MHHPLTTGLIVIGIIVGIGAMAFGAATARPHLAIGGFLIGFALLKGGLGLDAMLRWRGGAGPDPTVGQRSVFTLGLWIAFRFAVAILALCVGAWLLVSPQALNPAP